MTETPPPDWVVVGESVQIRPYNWYGVIAYVGPTEFAPGTWIGVDLDVPTGKKSMRKHSPVVCLLDIGPLLKNPESILYHLCGWL